MKRTKIVATTLLFFMLSAPAFAEEIKPVKLPVPQTEGGKPLMQALKERKSIREFRGKEISPQILSNLLWAAAGVNRPDGRRTVPSAHNAQEIDVYVAKKEGLYLYNASKNELHPVQARDIREFTGKQSFVKNAPIVLIFVADLSRIGRMPESDADFYTAVDTGYISQNVYLYCASEGFATVVLGWVDKEELAETMKLRKNQKIILTQPVGYPKK